MRTRSLLCAFPWFLLFVAAIFAPRAEAQVLYGSIVGNVTDSTGGVVAGATVEITNRGTGLTREAVTNDTGLYTFQNVVAGVYDLTVTHPGFSTYTQQGISVSVNTVQRQNVVLQVGQVTETVNVAASALTLQTERADVSAEVTTREVTDLPLPRYRNYQSLINLVPGATPGRFQNANTDTPARGLTTNVNGTSRNNNNTRIDGTQSMLIQLPHHTAYVPGAETIEVVNVATNNFEAEQGMAGGAAITVTTKSGTNDLHGSAFALHENGAIAAKDYFFRDEKRPKNIINIHGFTLGGPIVRDKLFYFGSWEGTRERAAYNRFFTIPTEDQRRGDFSAYAGTILYDPATGDGQGRNRTPFQGNIIPLSRQSPVTRKLQDFLPAANQPGRLAQNFFNAGTDVTNRDQFDVKINWNRSPTHTIFGKYGIMDAQISGTSGIGSGGPPGGRCLCAGGAGTGDTVVQTATIGMTKTFTPTFVYDMTVGWTRMGQIVIQELRGTDFGRDVLGIPGTNGTSINESGMPSFDIQGYDRLGDGDTWNPVTRHDQTPTMSHNFSWMKGSHNVRFGFDGLQHRLNMWQPGGGGPKGLLSFTDGNTRLNGGPAGTQFNSWASFLLGSPQTVSRSSQWEDRTGYEFQFGLYIRDRWQVNPKLTLTYGLRWEKYPVFTRAAGRPGLEDWDPNTNLMAIGGFGGNPQKLGVTDSNRLFAPRLGIAYRLTNDMVIRTGYGITIDPATYARSFSGYPLSVSVNAQGLNAFTPYAPIEQGIPPVIGPSYETGFIPVPGTVAVTRIAPKNIVRGYIQSWNFVVENRLPGEFITSIGYIGTAQTNQRISLETNAAPPGTGNPGRPYFAPYGRIANTSHLNAGVSSNYHSMQIAINRRGADGLMLKGAYTWSHAINYVDDVSGGLTWPLFDMRARNRASATYNQPHVFQMGFVYETPFGQGKRYATSGPSSWLLGGWQMNGVLAMFTGRHFTVSASGANLNAPGAGTQTADQVKPTVQKIGTVEEWFDKTAFAPVDRRTGTLADFGSTGRNILRGPGVVNLDLSLFRDFVLTESMKLQFRAETFNISNTPHFNPPQSNVNNANFMRITSTLGSDVGRDGPNRSIRFGLRLYW